MLPIEQIHPFIVHFPIAFFLSLFFVDLYARLRNIPLDGRGGLANLSAGLALLAGLSAVIAALFGSLALDVASSAGVSRATTGLHEALGGTTANGLAGWGVLRAFVWHQKFAISKAMTSAIVVAELALLALIVAAAFTGGQLVYEFGVNVSRPAG